jgi:hypothetical protein
MGILGRQHYLRHRLQTVRLSINLVFLLFLSARQISSSSFGGDLGPGNLLNCETLPSFSTLGRRADHVQCDTPQWETAVHSARRHAHDVVTPDRAETILVSVFTQLQTITLLYADLPDHPHPGLSLLLTLLVLVFVLVIKRGRPVGTTDARHRIRHAHAEDPVGAGLLCQQEQRAQRVLCQDRLVLDHAGPGTGAAARGEKKK